MRLDFMLALDNGAFQTVIAIGFGPASGRTEVARPDPLGTASTVRWRGIGSLGMQLDRSRHNVLMELFGIHGISPPSSFAEWRQG